MRFLALQTDVTAFKKRFIAEGEEELLTTTHHFFSFLAGIILASVIGLSILAATLSLTIVGGIDVMIGLGVLALAVAFYLYYFFKAYVDWRFNFLIVTTEKVLVVDHESFLHQHVEPIHIGNIASCNIESQFYGLFHCGRLRIRLNEREGGTTKEVVVSYLPKPDLIAGVIEKATVLVRQRTPVDKGIEAQKDKVEEAREEARVVLGAEPENK